MVEHGRAAVLEIDLNLLEELQPKAKPYKKLRRFPASAFDLSVIAAPRALIGDVKRRLVEYAGDSLVSIAFLRDFALGDDEGNRSLSFRLTVGSEERTLSAEEVGQIRERVIAGMRESGYQLKV